MKRSFVSGSCRYGFSWVWSEASGTLPTLPIFLRGYGMDHKAHTIGHKTRARHGTAYTHVKPLSTSTNSFQCSPDEVLPATSHKNLDFNHWRQLWCCGLVMTSGTLKSSWFLVETHRDPEMKETPSRQVMAMQGGHPTWRQCKVPNPDHLILKDHFWAHKAINFAILPWSTWLGFSQIFTGNGCAPKIDQTKKEEAKPRRKWSHPHTANPKGTSLSHGGFPRATNGEHAKRLPLWVG